MRTAPPGDVQAVARTIGTYRPRSCSEEVAAFARAVVAEAGPSSPSRAKALLFAAAKVGTFAATCGLALSSEVCLHQSVIERFVCTEARHLSPATARTLRSNLRSLGRALCPTPPPTPLPRERSKAPYSPAEMAAYCALASAQPTEARRHRVLGLISLGAGAGLMGGDLRGVRGTDVIERSGGLVVTAGGRRPRAVPVLACYHRPLLGAARFAKDRYVIGGREPERRTVTTPLVSSLAGGRDLSPLDTGRLRATWLAACAETIGLRAFMDAAGITCSQRLGDIVAGLDEVDEQTAVGLLGGRS